MRSSSFARFDSQQGSEIQPQQAPGFRYNPYAYLDSGSDPHLLEYIVDHRVFLLATREQPALVVAEPGSGKTATRIAVARSCLMAHSGRSSFPIIYNLPDYFTRPDQDISAEAHLRALLRAGAAGLLLFYAFRPEQYLALTPAAQSEAAGVWQQHLPLQLAYYLDILEQTGDPNQLIAQLEASYPSGAAPAYRLVEDFCQNLRAAPARPWSEPPAGQFARLCDFILDTAGARSIIILTDGVDAFPLAGQTRQQQAQQYTGALCSQAGALARQGVYLKVFLPSPVAVGEALETISIVWSVAEVAELLRRRVYAATAAQTASLDAYATIDVHDIEGRLAQAAGPRPREAIYLAGKCYNHLIHGAAPSLIDDPLITDLLRHYRARQH